jgi:hypothetical protein
LVHGRNYPIRKDDGYPQSFLLQHCRFLKKESGNNNKKLDSYWVDVSDNARTTRTKIAHALRAATNRVHTSSSSSSAGGQWQEHYYSRPVAGGGGLLENGCPP